MQSRCMRIALTCAVNWTCDSHNHEEGCAYCVPLYICSVHFRLDYITAAAILVGLWDAVLAALDGSLCVNQRNALGDLHCRSCSSGWKAERTVLHTQGDA